MNDKAGPAHRPLPGEISLLLRAEGAAAAGLALYAYSGTDSSGWILALLILLPDISMLGYLAGPRIGATSYNAAHSYLAPALAWLLLQAIAPDWADPVALIWVAHIGVDRMLGYGLKYRDSFRRTHLSIIGPRRSADLSHGG